MFGWRSSCNADDVPGSIHSRCFCSLRVLTRKGSKFGSTNETKIGVALGWKE